MLVGLSAITENVRLSEQATTLSASFLDDNLYLGIITS